MYDLIVKAGVVVDPAQKLHDVKDIAVSKGRIAAVEDELRVDDAKLVVNADGKIVTPGLIDLHVHAYGGVGRYGLDADISCLPTGVTTALDAGTTGAETFVGFKRYVLDKSRTRLYAFVHIVTDGLAREPELDRLSNADASRTAEICEAYPDLIRGVKVRLTRNAVVSVNPLDALDLALEAAERSGLPLMVHGIRGDEKYSRDVTGADVISRLRRGDILTHTYAPSSSILDAEGNVSDEACRAASRGVIFDVGHGAGSFSFQTARKALAQGFKPHTISSDMHAISFRGPMFDLGTTLSKLMILGLPFDEVIEKATLAPAMVLGIDKGLGRLSEGAEADIVIFKVLQGKFFFRDVLGESMTGSKWLVPTTVIRGGEVNIGGTWSQVGWAPAPVTR